LTKEQELLLDQNNMLAGRLATFGQWSNAAAAATIDKEEKIT